MEQKNRGGEKGKLRRSRKEERLEGKRRGKGGMYVGMVVWEE